MFHGMGDEGLGAVDGLGDGAVDHAACGPARQVLEPQKITNSAINFKRPFAGPEQVLAYLPLHPSGRDLQQPAHRRRRDRAICNRAAALVSTSPRH